MGKQKEKKKDVAVMEVPRDLANKIRHIADVFDLNIPDVFHRRLRASIERDYQKAQEVNRTELGEAGA